MPHHAYRRRPRSASFAALIALWCCTAAALSGARAGESAAQNTGVLRATLPNGLRVVIVRNALAPVVATAVNYLVGSDEAPAGFPGTAHAEEHMMFRGSPGLSADQLADIGSVVGGDFNANTREGMTQYLFTVPAEDLDVALHIEALRMRAVLYSPKEWSHERGAIEQEVAQDLSEPSYVLFEKLRARMFAGTPYAHDALGTRPSFEKTTARMLKSFHDTWYAPNNAILVIAGDLDPEATLSEVKLLFGDIAAKKLPPKPQVRLRPVRPISFTLDTDRPSGTLMIALRTAGPRAADFAALEVLADVLSSRRFDLYGLVPRGKAVAAEFALDPLPQAALAYAMLSFTTGDDPKALERLGIISGGKGEHRVGKGCLRQRIKRELRGHCLAPRHQAVQIEAPAAEHIREHLECGEVGSAWTGGAQRNHERAAGPVGVQREGYGSHGAQAHLRLGRQFLRRDVPEQQFHLAQGRLRVEVPGDHQDGVVGRVPGVVEALQHARRGLLERWSGAERIVGVGGACEHPGAQLLKQHVGRLGQVLRDLLLDRAAFMAPLLR